ncbi:MAG: NADH-quinone oxidoreductase subunit A [Blastocatellia bacterium]|nr:NADH-quinone oxidoreductase subunit A [Blastocatellia bacterium]MBL8194709.1 NADH-quinone oxidoreductase subunit A [Blastocatellia bacterium]MBN8722976.1 NADH-quinone oxidoreductase subunit A [Acidobacteriota bacterium]
MINYLPILMMLGLSIVVAGTLVGVSQLLGQYIPTREKLMPYECGKDPVGSAHERFSVKFYMIALLFILFDIEAIFFVPWAVIFRQLAADLTAGKIYNLAANDLSKMFVFWEMLVFIAILLVGYIYVWKKGILDWRK